MEIWRCSTLPVLYSTEAAFFLLSVTNAPAIVAVTVSGGMCRRPGPIVKVFFLPVPWGKALFAISSPGRTIVADEAMVNDKEKSVSCCSTLMFSKQHVQ